MQEKRKNSEINRINTKIILLSFIAGVLATLFVQLIGLIDLSPYLENNNDETTIEHNANDSITVQATEEWQFTGIFLLERYFIVFIPSAVAWEFGFNEGFIGILMQTFFSI